MRLAHALSAAAIGAVLVTLSCQAIVTSDVPAFTCDGTAESCPQGKYCKGVGCADCESRDVCDGFDNDCNGKIDDGTASDADGDGYTVCGRPDPDNSGGRIKADCDDTNAKTHPGAMEVCNGVDDDCNGKTDEDACPFGQVCAGEPKKCVVPCDPKSCTSPRTCSTVSLLCVDPNPQPIGSACIDNVECMTNLKCISKDTLDPGVLPDPSKGMCTMMCCTSSDCPANFVCYAPGNGGHYCVDPRKIGRNQALGTKTAGSTAAVATECRSGSLASGRCADTCCNDAQCASGSRCQYDTADGHNGTFCRPSNAGGGQNSSCLLGGDADCRSGVCLDYTVVPPFYNYRCVDICCGSDSCGNLPSGATSCNYFQNKNQNDFAPFCLADHGSGTKTLGQPCASNGECRSDFCTGGSGGFCSDVCCTDADCTKANLRCGLISNRPRCVKP